MLAHRDNKIYVQWSLETTVQDLCDRFSNSLIFMIKPSYMHLKTISSYKNFVESDNLGIPSYSENGTAWEHLHILVKNASEQIPTEKQVDFIKKHLHIVGFSKGCVVLNQLIYELPALLSSTENSEFVTLCDQISWLDGGHNGSKGSWFTRKDLLQSGLKMTSIKINIHVTPYQVGQNSNSLIIIIITV